MIPDPIGVIDGKEGECQSRRQVPISTPQYPGESTSAEPVLDFIITNSAFAKH